MRLLGCFLLLVLTGHAWGQVTAKDVRDVWEADCQRGDFSSCLFLGIAYDDGKGVTQDKFKAVKLYTKACELRDGRGCSNLGLMYSNGEGVKLDKRRALELYGKACDLKEELGCENYAILKNQGL